MTPIVREDYVLMRPFNEERKTASGIIMAGEGRTPERRATVVAVGPGTFTQDGVWHPLDLEPGDRVYYSSVEFDVMSPTEDGSFEKLIVVRAQRIFMKEPRGGG